MAPQELRQRLVDEIWRCCLEHDPEHPARMVLKCNGLVDRGVIAELYRASQAGVQIDLIIRGICCLKPGVPGLSDNIRVISILGRFLEHSRIYSFRTAQAETTYIGSADLMPRNIDARIEVITPVEDPYLVAEIDAALDLMLADTAGCWWLDADGHWHRRRPGEGDVPFSSQAALMERAVAVADGEARGDRREAAAERRLVRRPAARKARCARRPVRPDGEGPSRPDRPGRALLRRRHEDARDPRARAAAVPRGHARRLRHRAAALDARRVAPAARRARGVRRLLAEEAAPRSCCGLVKETADALSDARDLDVQIDYLTGYREHVPAADRAGIDSLIALLRVRRTEADAHLAPALARLDDEDFAGQVERLVESAP